MVQIGVSESNQRKKTLKMFRTGHLILGIRYKGDNGFWEATEGMIK